MTAVLRFTGEQIPKIGIEEFLALAEVWGFSESALARIRAAVEGEALEAGPWLARYLHPSQSRVGLLEARARELFGARHALAVHSGTSALETALIACGIGPGDEVIVPGYTFFATATAVVAAGAVPVIAEVDESLTLDPVNLERAMTARTKAIVAVHMLGAPAELDAIVGIASHYGIHVIEDAAQACGVRYKGRRVGTIGAAGCFSISSWKAVGGGEGGLVLTDSDEVYIRALNQHDTAANWRPDRYARERFDGELFCGTNVRMSELEGAVNLVQLGKMDEVLERYRRNKRRILADLAFGADFTRRVVHDSDGELGNHLVLFAPSADASASAVEAMRAEGVPAWGYGLGRGKRDWHIYAYWDQILERKTSTRYGLPWNLPVPGQTFPQYDRDMCPRVLDLVGRAVIIQVVDWWNEEDCANVAHGINRALDP